MGDTLTRLPPQARLQARRSLSRCRTLTMLAGLMSGAVIAACSQPAPGGSSRLPTPRLAPPDESVSAAPGQPVPYFGPAHVELAVTPPRLGAKLAVYSFAVPSEADLATTARVHGGRPVKPRPPNYREPLIFFNSGSLSAAGPAPTPEAAGAAATAFLARQGVTPTWSYRSTEVTYGAFGVVNLVRQFPFDGHGPAEQIDAHGTDAGASIVVGPDGEVRQATVPVALALHKQDRRTAAANLMAGAVTRTPPGPKGSEPEAVVALTAVTLCYIAVTRGGTGYFEPVLLFTGDFQRNGTTFRLRRLVPALDASELAIQ